MPLDRVPLTVTIITLNEERNLARALKSVAWADERLVVDSGSTDRTLEIARAHGARVLENRWPGYGQQKNFGQKEAKNDWVLNVDADECVSADLRTEIEAILTREAKSPSRVRGYAIPRKTWYLGRWIMHGGWYPNYLVRLADRRVARWTEPEVHESLQVTGDVERLVQPLEHYTFRSIEDQVKTNLKFSRLGYQSLVARGRKPSLSMLIFKPWGKFFETYLLKRGFLDGLPGLIISVNAAHSMFLKFAYFYENTDRRQ